MFTPSHPSSCRTMEEDDRDEILGLSDEEESLSEAEEHSVSFDKPDNARAVQVYEQHTKTEFFCVKLILILSSTFVMVLLPLYMESINVKSDAYTLILSTNTLTVVTTLLLLIIIKNSCPHYKNMQIFKFPVPGLKVIQVSVIYTLSGFMVIYAMDRKRVMCHVQDPVKGVVLIFSLLYYFFFCRKCKLKTLFCSFVLSVVKKYAKNKQVKKRQQLLIHNFLLSIINWYRIFKVLTTAIRFHCTETGISD